MDYSPVSEGKFWPFLKASKNTGEAMPTKIGVHAFYINPTKLDTHAYLTYIFLHFLSNAIMQYFTPSTCYMYNWM